MLETVSEIIEECDAATQNLITQHLEILPSKDSLRRIPSRELYLGGKIKAPQWPLTEAKNREWNPFSLFHKGWLYFFA